MQTAVTSCVQQGKEARVTTQSSSDPPTTTSTMRLLHGMHVVAGLYCSTSHQKINRDFRETKGAKSAVNEADFSL